MERENHFCFCCKTEYNWTPTEEFFCCRACAEAWLDAELKKLANGPIEDVIEIVRLACKTIGKWEEKQPKTIAEQRRKQKYISVAKAAISGE